MQRNDGPRIDDDSCNGTPELTDSSAATRSGENAESSNPKANLLPMWILFAAVILVGVAWGLSDIYFNSYTEGDEITFIKADQSPTKVKPLDPGGVDILYRDIDVYEEGASKKQEAVQLLPPPEEPMQRSDLRGFANNKENTNASSPLEKDVNDEDYQKELSQSKSSTLNNTLDDGKDVNNLPVQDLKKDALAVKSKPVVKAARPNYFIQVSASKNEEATIKEISRFSSEHASLLEKSKIMLDRIDLGKKGIWFRIHIGPFSLRTDAGITCDKLKVKGIGCFIIAK